MVHLGLAYFFNIYQVVPNIDIPMHFLGGVCIAYFISGSYRVARAEKLLGKPNELIHAISVFGLTGIATIFWEFAEFSADALYKAGFQDGLPDTMLDILLGLTGSVVFLLIWHFWQKKPAQG